MPDIPEVIGEEDRAALRDALLLHRADGNPRPLIPAFDVNGDGTVDFFGLDEDDALVVVDGATLEESVYRADGEEDAHADEVAARLSEGEYVLTEAEVRALGDRGVTPDGE